MNSNSRRTLLGMAAVMGLGLLVLGTKPAAAHSKRSSYTNGNRYGNDSYGSRHDGRYRRYGHDVDGDGIPNQRDRDIDGDGIPNHRDHKRYGSGFDYSDNSRYRRRDDGVRNRRDRDNDGDGRRNGRDRRDRNLRRR